MKRFFTNENSAKGDCPLCHCENAIWWKLIGISGDEKIIQFHYWFSCPDCKNKHAFPRNKYAYTLLKDKKWNYSKRYQKLYLKRSVS